MEKLKINLYCISFNLQSLTNEDLKLLDSIKLIGKQEDILKVYQKIRRKLFYLPIEQLAIVQKCNGIIIFTICFRTLDPELIHDNLIKVWIELANLKSENTMKLTHKLQYFQNEEALLYIAECACGLRSLVPGDIQVFSQVTKSFKESPDYSKYPILDSICQWLSEVNQKVNKETKFHTGLISVERIVSDIIVKECAKIDKNQNGVVSILGFGMSGKLITKILIEETSLLLNIYSRNIQKVSEQLLEFSEDQRKRIKISDIGIEKIINAAANCIVVCLEKNTETQKIVNNLYYRIYANRNNNRMLLVDISGLISEEVEKRLKNQNINVVSLVEVLNRGRNVIENRKSEIGKVKSILHQSLINGIKKINDSYEQYIFEQQRKKFEISIGLLDREKTKILKIRSDMLNMIREYLKRSGFTEITTPCIVCVSTDPPYDKTGDAFLVQYHSLNTLLRQSNQIYKQLVVLSGIKRVFEIGPFWRKESIHSKLHLEEALGIDVEMEVRNLEVLISIAYEMILLCFELVSKKNLFRKKLVLPSYKRVPIITYSDALSLLEQNNFQIDWGKDLGILGNAQIGLIVKEIYGSDIVVIKDFPDSVKKFYIKCKKGGLTFSFDIILDGWEIVSGGLRETREKVIRERMKLAKVDPFLYEFYLKAFRKNVKAHGGFCIGFERLVAKLLGFKDIKDAVPYPRTFESLFP
ncbi:MAG: amino acid--tRNA ligase-related protein [Fervidobacterium sp.]